jgi:hypothetical protein
VEERPHAEVDPGPRGAWNERTLRLFLTASAVSLQSQVWQARARLAVENARTAAQLLFSVVDGNYRRGRDAAWAEVMRFGV